MKGLTAGLGAMLLAVGAASPAPAATSKPDPLETTVIAMERASWVAWQGHDGAFFDRFLSDDHVEVGIGGPGDKASVVAGVAKGGCKVASYAVDHFTFTRFSADSALLTYRAAQDTTCGGAAVPSPVWASSFFVKRHGRWQNVVYVHTPIPKKG
jgi:hypothetical protein